MEIQPKIQPYVDMIYKKLVANPLTKDLDQKKYFTFFRSIKKSIELFREANIPLQAELSVLQQQFGVMIRAKCRLQLTVKNIRYNKLLNFY